MEVDELGLVGVEQEAPSVVAHRVAADAGLRVFKLLFHVLDDTLAVQTQEGSAHQLRMHRMCAYHLPANANQRADAKRGQLTDPREPHHKENIKQCEIFQDFYLSHCTRVNEVLPKYIYFFNLKLTKLYL